MAFLRLRRTNFDALVPALCACIEGPERAHASDTKCTQNGPIVNNVTANIYIIYND